MIALIIIVMIIRREKVKIWFVIYKGYKLVNIYISKL